MVLEKAVVAEPEALEQQIVQQVRETIGPVASLRDVVMVSALPKTRSGKILRRLLREIAEHGIVDIPATAESPQAIEQIIKRVTER